MSFWLKIFFVSVACSLALPTSAQYRIAFWNVENYFDTKDDPVKNDNEYTPSGERHWTWKRFQAKRDGIAKTIIDMGSPIVMGLSEVENHEVLKELCQASPLRRLRYGFIHYDSPDARGIDCALLYRKDSVKVIEQRAISVSDSASGFFKRDILLAGLRLPNGDTLYCFVNHWPSKLGGAEAAVKRQAIALRLASLMDSVARHHPHAEVIAMGDFNSTPDELKAMLPPRSLRSLMDALPSGEGSYNYQGVWQLIDHMLAVPSQKTKTLHAAIFHASYLLERDKKHMGQKPRRTYTGPRYHGGLSDHLPIYLDWPR